MNTRMAMLNEQALPTAVRKSNRVTAFKAALLAYEVLFRRFRVAVGLLVVPMTLAGLVLYVSLSAYLSELLTFLETRDPRAASLALGSLAAGIFLWLFCCAVAIGAISKLALGRESRGSWQPFRADLQAWRLYAAYLRFLLLVATVTVFTYLCGAFIAPLIHIPNSVAFGLLSLAGGLVILWLTVRIGFLIAPVVACTKGPVLRRALKESAADFWRNAVLVMLLLAPGIAIQAIGEFFLRMGLAPPSFAGGLLLTNQAQAMEQALAGFLAVVSLSSTVSVALLTYGAMAAYRYGRVRAALDAPSAPQAGI